MIHTLGIICCCISTAQGAQGKAEAAAQTEGHEEGTGSRVRNKQREREKDPRNEKPEPI